MEHKILKNSGFSLVEIMIAVSLFTIVMLISSNMFLRAIESQVKSITTKDIQEGLNYAMTVMVNETASAQIDPTSCSPAPGVCDDPSYAKYFFCTTIGNTLIFKNSSSECVIYSMVGVPGVGSILQVTRNGVTNNLTPSTFNLTSTKFYLDFNINDDETFSVSKLTISLKGQSITPGNNQESIILQTTNNITWQQ